MSSKTKPTKLQLLLQGALLIAIAVILQALRLLIPLPLPVSTFIIGTLVHMMLTLTIQLNSLTVAALLSVALPLFAYAQGQLALPILIPVVILGNLVFVLLVRQYNQGWQLALPPLAKALSMGLAAYGSLSFIGLGGTPLFKALCFAMTVPQLITGILGLLLAQRLKQALEKRHRL